jgi:hypothetical protein
VFLCTRKKTTKMGRARRVLTVVPLGLGLRDLHVCQGDPSHLNKIKFATKSDEGQWQWLRCDFTYNYILIWMKQRKWAACAEFSGRSTGARASRLAFLSREPFTLVQKRIRNEIRRMVSKQWLWGRCVSMYITYYNIKEPRARSSHGRSTGARASSFTFL